MASIRATMKVERKGDASKNFKQILQSTKGPTKVKVGFPSGKAPGDLISIAYWNHEGTNRAKGDIFLRNGKTGVSGPIPPRPFITVAMYKGRGKIRSFLGTTARAMLQGKADLKTGLTKLGMTGQDMIQVQIGSNMGPPNSGMTIYLKGSSKTLVDNGRMFQSVTWDFDK